jgi:hypothetical protein
MLRKPIFYLIYHIFYFLMVTLDPKWLISLATIYKSRKMIKKAITEYRKVILQINPLHYSNPFHKLGGLLPSPLFMEENK